MAKGKKRKRKNWNFYMSELRPAGACSSEPCAPALAKKKSFIEKLLPKHMIIPLIFLIIGNAAAYYGPRYLNVLFHRSYLDMSCAVDSTISVFPPFAIIYVLAFPFWYLTAYLYLRKDRDHAYRYALTNVAAKVVCAVLFITVPSTLIRPEITGGTICHSILKIVYATDAPNNLFPSIHCLESWICFRCIYDDKQAPRWLKIFTFVFAILICASTVLTKQHVLLDIPAGVFLAELTWRLSSVHPIKKCIRRISQLIRF